eukprot:14427.XXX_396985_397122_1 [CDS] Oithona nana genome sequencing.
MKIDGAVERAAHGQQCLMVFVQLGGMSIFDFSFVRHTDDKNEYFI